MKTASGRTTPTTHGAPTGGKSRVRRDGRETVITPGPLHLRPGCGRARTLHASRHGAVAAKSTEYDLLGRMTSSTDDPGRVPPTLLAGTDDDSRKPSLPGLDLSRSAPDGTVEGRIRHGQRHVVYATIDLVATVCGRFTKAVTETQTGGCSAAIVNRAGKPCAGVPSTVSGVIYTRNTYNARSSSPKTQTDAGNAATTMAPTLCRIRRWQQNERNLETRRSATVSNSRITAVELRRGTGPGMEVYRVVTATRNNSRGTTYNETQKTLRLPPSRPRWKANLSFPSIPETLPNNGANTVRAPSGRRKAASPPTYPRRHLRRHRRFYHSQTDPAGVTAPHTRAYTETGVIYATARATGATRPRQNRYRRRAPFR